MIEVRYDSENKFDEQLFFRSFQDLRGKLNHHNMNEHQIIQVRQILIDVINQRESRISSMVEYETFKLKLMDGVNVVINMKFHGRDIKFIKQHQIIEDCENVNTSSESDSEDDDEKSFYNNI